MSMQSVGMRAYSEALQHFNMVEGALKQGMPVHRNTLFSRTLDQNLLRDRVDRGENSGAQADFISYADREHTPVMPDSSFTRTITKSLNRVNELQRAKAQAVEDFASGRSQNVHELMITMQKSSLAMKMTTAVRGKVLEAYKELSKIQF